MNRPCPRSAGMFGGFTVPTLPITTTSCFESHVLERLAQSRLRTSLKVTRRMATTRPTVCLLCQLAEI